MSLTFSEVISYDHSPLSEDHVKQSLIDSLKKDFDKVKIKEKKEGDFLRCRIKTKLWNPIVSIKGPLRVQVKDQKAKVLIDGETKTNGWFWFTLILAFFLLAAGGAGLILFIMMFFMHSSQKKRSAEALESAFRRIRFESESF